jgi:hypothetical protein
MLVVSATENINMVNNNKDKPLDKPLLEDKMHATSASWSFLLRTVF